MKKITTILAILAALNINAQTYVIQSKTYLEFNKPSSVVERDTSKIIGVINSIQVDAYQNFTYNYCWYYSDFSKKVKCDSYSVSKEVRDSVYNLVKPLLPATTGSYTLDNQIVDYFGMMAIGSQTWSVDLTNWEIKVH